jgi:LmbE family N-acetylglucosaminyl deacetylase
MTLMKLEELGKSIVVISPHDDDGIIGCAGILADLKRKNIHTHALIMTDGSLGYSSVENKDAIRETRRREAEKAYERVGAEPIFLGFADMNLKPFACWETVSGRDGAYKKVLKILRQLRPRTVFVSNPGDWHPDHQASFDVGVSIANLAAVPAVADFGEPIDLGNIFCYKVWDKLTKVTHTHRLSQRAQETKSTEIAEFRSQGDILNMVNLELRMELFQKLK